MSSEIRSTQLALALDTDGTTALSLVGMTEASVDIYKVGLTLWGQEGPTVVRALAERKPVFLDLKLHDIPAQVEGAAGAAAELGASFVTVHAAGGREMISAAARGAGPARGDRDSVGTRILAVTVLTSLDDADLDSIGVRDDAGKQVLRLAELALEAGAHGLVCSPHEVGALRERFGPEPILVVPGIRPAGSEAGDQKRTLTPGEAAQAGADIIVIGRPITAAADPGEAAARIKASLP